MPKRSAHILFYLLILFSVRQPLHAQTPVQWSKPYGTGAMEFARHGIQTKDDSFIAIGNAWSTTGSFIDYMVVKTDKDGQLEWQKTFGGSKQDYGYAIAQTSDGGYVLVGGSESSDGMVSTNKGLMDIWIIKLDGKGNLSWERNIGGSSHEQAETVTATDDGGFILGGYTSSTDGDVIGNDGGTDVWIVKFSATGNISWQNCFGGSLLDIVSDLTTTNDGGYIFTGYTRSSDGDVKINKGKDDLWIVKLDDVGNIQWEKTYGGSQFDAGEDINPTRDGGYIVTGMTTSTDGDVTGNHGLMDFWVLKIGATGDLQWQQCYGGRDEDFGAGGFQAADNTYFISSLSRSSDGQITASKGQGDSWVLNIDLTGKVLWQKSYGGSQADVTSAMVATSDGYFATFGSSASNNGDVTGNNGSDDFWIMKFGPDTKCLPTLKINASTNNTCLGTPVRITATVNNGGTNPVYKWKVNNSVAGTNTAIFSSSNFKHGDEVSCEYSCRTVCGKDTVITSNVIILSVLNDVPASLTIAADKSDVCSGDEVRFTANAQYGNLQPTYSWIVDGTTHSVNSSSFTANPLANTKVTCIMTLATPACPVSIKRSSNEVGVIVRTIKEPFVSITTATDTICLGSAATFTASSNAGSDAAYHWKVNGAEVVGNDIQFQSSTLQHLDAISCTLVLLPSARCFTADKASSDPIVMQVKNIAAPSVTVQPIASVGCKGESFSFLANPVNAGSNPHYQWRVNGNNIFAGSGSFTISFLEDGDRVSCALLAQNIACPVTETVSNIVTVQVKPVPLISFSPAEISIAPGKQATLSPTIIGNPATYHWMPAQFFNNPSAASPTTLPLTSDQTFQVNVTDGNGCQATASVRVKVFNKLYIPTAFTPNGDGKNDLLKPLGAQMKEVLYFRIMNRWSEVVFETKKPGEGWNGLFQGRRQPSDTYVWIFKGLDTDGNLIVDKGTTTLIY